MSDDPEDDVELDDIANALGVRPGLRLDVGGRMFLTLLRHGLVNAEGAIAIGGRDLEELRRNRARRERLAIEVANAMAADSRSPFLI